jgi:hypothetical protein
LAKLPSSGNKNSTEAFIHSFLFQQKNKIANLMSEDTPKDDTIATESTGLLEDESPAAAPAAPPSPTHGRSNTGAMVPDFVFTSIDNWSEAIHDVQEQMEDIATDWTTFETLDEDAAVARAEECLDLETVADTEEREELIEEFIHPEDPMDPFLSNKQEKLGVLPLAILVFYNVSGGPFGVETSVRAGGNFYALLGFLVLPFVWSCQEALMTAELGTAFPEASGGVAWVEEAFGPSVGWMSGYLGWIAGGAYICIHN